MKKVAKKLVLLFITFILLFLTSIQVQAYQDESVEFYLFFTWMEEDGSWHEWINVTDDYYTDINLKINQTIKCKIKTAGHVKGTIVFELYEPGNVDTFEILEGLPQDESEYFRIDFTISDLEAQKQKDDAWYGEEDNLYEYHLVNDTIEYTWVLRTTDRWHGGRAPINIYWQASPAATEKDIYGDWIYPDAIYKDKTFANPYIENEQWTGPSYNSDTNGDNNNGNENDNNDDDNTPGFETILLIASLLAVILLYKKRKP